MLEMLINPRKAERQPWELFFVGLFYASLSILIVHWVFGADPVLAKYSGILMVTFSVMFTLPFIYYTLKLEEEKDESDRGFFKLLFEHSKALDAFIFLFLGFVVAFSFWYVLLGNSQSFLPQIETYCSINRPSNIADCVSQYAGNGAAVTGAATSGGKVLNIFANNINVLIFTLVFSLIFGAGAIFVLAWNASVIAAAVGIFANSESGSLPCGLWRYMIHGIPEIGAYFVGALAGGIISMAIVKHEIGSEKFWKVLQDSLNLIIIAVIILFLSALVEVFVTPGLARLC